MTGLFQVKDTLVITDMNFKMARITSRLYRGDDNRVLIFTELLKTQ